MVDPTALGDVSSERIEAALPDRPVTSLRDIEAIYGELYALAELGSDDYAKYRTPDAAADLVGMDDSVLVVRIDVRGETARFKETKPVVTETYREDLGPMLAHSKYASARGVDHSLTHQSGRDNSAEKLAVHASDRFTRWPTEDAIRETAEVHDDGWLIDVLADLGEDDEAMAALEDAAANEVPDEATMLVTVAIALDPDDEQSVTKAETYKPDAKYHYPGEFEVFQEAMAARKTRKFKAKNEAKDAVGDGVCFVNDTEEPVYGVVDDPMKSYLSKQAEKFPRFDSDESWRTQPLSRDAAIAAQNADTFLDACQYSGARGASVYYLPYLRGENVLDPEEGKWLFRTLAHLTNDDADTEQTALERAYETFEGTKELLRYAVFVVHKYQKDRWRLVAGSTNVSAVETSELAESHRNALESRSFARDGAFETDAEWPLLHSGQHQSTLVGLVSKPGYFFRTCAEIDEDDPSADDLRFRATVAAISGESIRVESLLKSYVERIADEFNASDGLRGFPDRLVASQYAQLAALADRGILDASRGTTEPVENFLQMTDEPSETERSRTEKLDEFIDRHPALAGEENYERRGAFYLGALVGRLSRYQANENKTMTAVKSNPVDSLTKHNIKRTAKEVTRQNIVYSDEEGYTGTMYAELMDGVADDLQRENPEDWDITTEDLRFHYAMGIAYGKNDQTTLNYEDDNDD
jgi:hypothetical protein